VIHQSIHFIYNSPLTSRDEDGYNDVDEDGYNDDVDRRQMIIEDT